MAETQAQQSRSSAVLASLRPRGRDADCSQFRQLSFLQVGDDNDIISRMIKSSQSLGKATESWDWKD